MIFLKCELRNVISTRLNNGVLQFLADQYSGASSAHEVFINNMRESRMLWMGTNVVLFVYRVYWWDIVWSLQDTQILDLFRLEKTKEGIN